MKLIGSICLVLFVGIIVAQQVPNDKKILVYFERTACFGSCPTFKFTIYKNYTANYNGIRHVDSIGKFQLSLPKKVVKQWIAFAKKNGFFKFNNQYPTGESPVADLPRTLTYVKGKRVLNLHWDSPESLLLIENAMDSLLMKYKFSPKFSNPGSK